MNDKEIRISQMGTRMRDFGLAQSAAFPPISLGGQKFAALGALVTQIDQIGSDQAQASGAARSSTSAKAAARERVRKLMKAMRDTAVALEPEQPGISKSFRMPPTNGDEALINSARAFVVAATPLKALFIGHEMPATFLDDLNEAVEQFEACVSGFNLSRGKSTAATASLKDALSQIVNLKRVLDPVVRNKFRNDPATLAAWESASHLERAPRKSAPAKAAPSQT